MRLFVYLFLTFTGLLFVACDSGGPQNQDTDQGVANEQPEPGMTKESLLEREPYKDVVKVKLPADFTDASKDPNKEIIYSTDDRQTNHVMFMLQDFDPITKAQLQSGIQKTTEEYAAHLLKSNGNKIAEKQVKTMNGDLWGVIDKSMYTGDTRKSWERTYLTRFNNKLLTVGLYYNVNKKDEYLTIRDFIDESLELTADF